MSNQLLTRPCPVCGKFSLTLETAPGVGYEIIKVFAPRPANVSKEKWESEVDDKGRLVHEIERYTTEIDSHRVSWIAQQTCACALSDDVNESILVDVPEPEAAAAPVQPEPISVKDIKAANARDVRAMKKAGTWVPGTKMRSTIVDRSAPVVSAPVLSAQTLENITRSETGRVARKSGIVRTLRPGGADWLETVKGMRRVWAERAAAGYFQTGIPERGDEHAGYEIDNPYSESIVAGWIANYPALLASRATRKEDRAAARSAQKIEDQKLRDQAGEARETMMNALTWSEYEKAKSEVLGLKARMADAETGDLRIAG